MDIRTRIGGGRRMLGGLGLLIALLAARDVAAGNPRRPADIWHPAPATTWQIQYAGDPIDTSVDAQMYLLDGDGTAASVVSTLHAQGRKVVCYIDGGSWEAWRADAGQFPAVVLGNPYVGFPDERWLDIRRLDLLGPLMAARLDTCVAKGFDGVYPDNLNGYENATGFPLTAADQIAYNTWLAQAAHARGLSIGLNDPDQTADLVPVFDWTLLEECFWQGACGALSPFVAAGKAAFDIEYTDTPITPDQFCPQATALSISALLKHRNLDAWRVACAAPAPPTPAPTATPPCAVPFTDVAGNPFAAYIVRLYCAGTVEGYPDNTFRPYNDADRGTLARWIVRARGWAITTVGGPHFTDVAPTDALYPYVETAYNHGVLNGYADHTFRPAAPVTRGQMSKMLVNAQGWTNDIPAGTQDFRDVDAANPFYWPIESIYRHGLVSGYDCGPGCREFRWGANNTRGQLTKVLANAP
ncbi:MAG TPA: endo alpha-1,4 polygalactosaminidase [Chloroflexia bacterium]|nr:endo alpha-1,4 polygalactosaminidase [Chloroflexia bacterium]